MVVGNDLTEVTSVKSFLDSTFKIKNLRKLHYFLGIEFNHVPTGVVLSQRKFALELLQEFDTPSSTSVVSPWDLNTKLLHSEGAPIPDPS